MNISKMQKERYTYQPKIPAVLQTPLEAVQVKTGGPTQSVADQQIIKKIFSRTYGAPVIEFSTGSSNISTEKPALRVGVILSGGQAAGGHNVISGIFDSLQNINPESKLFGFLNGPSGLINSRYIELSSIMIDSYRNTGGFDIIGSGRTKIETDEQINSSIETAKKMNLNAIVIIGGDDSNTNAGLLAEHFLKAGLETRVIGVPKTIDGDLKNNMIECSFGFDTAVKTYSELIGNICRDANSAKKYWHFIKLMGRSASHIALECALQTHPNICLISEEIAEKKISLHDIINTILVPAIVNRAKEGKNFGIILIPEGLIEFIPEMKTLIFELNTAMANDAPAFNALKDFSEQCEWIQKTLSQEANKLFLYLPKEISSQLLVDRDPHGNVQVSRIDTEKLLALLTAKQLTTLKAENRFNGTFKSCTHFFGYEGRCAFPSNFDADYCYALGKTAVLLIAKGFTGYLASVRNLAKPAEKWICGGVPFTMMMNIETRQGQEKPVIKKALVDLSDKPYKTYLKNRDMWMRHNNYVSPGSIQYFGPESICDARTHTLMLESEYK